MKNLLLIRHAKSSWADASLADWERPLNPRGKKDAPAMGRRLKSKGLLPDAIIASPAKRALQTAKLIACELGFPRQRIARREEIYAQGLDALVALVAGLPEDWERVFVVGHNPELTDLANRLCAAGIEKLPTCGVASIEFAAATWRDCARGGGRLAFFERPPKFGG